MTPAQAETAVADACVLLRRGWQYASQHMSLTDFADDRLRAITDAASRCPEDGWCDPLARCQAIRLALDGDWATVEELMGMQSRAVVASAAGMARYAPLVHAAALRRAEAARMRAEAVALAEAADRVLEEVGG